MPQIRDTAYPRLAASPGAAELACFTPTPAEFAFVTGRTRRAGRGWRCSSCSRLSSAWDTSSFQGCAGGDRGAPGPQAGLADAGTLSDYESSTYRSRLMALVREFVGVSDYGRAVRRAAVRAGIEAARVSDKVADIINAVIEELVRQRFELPAFGTLLKIANAARAKVNRGYHRLVAGALAPEMRDRLNGLLVLPPGQARTAWDQVKTEPRRPTPRHMHDFLRHLDWLREQGAGTAVFCEVPAAKVRHFAAEARS